MFTFSTITLFVALRLLLSRGTVLAGWGGTQAREITLSNTTTPSAGSASGYWLASIQRQGTVPFGGSSGYQVFRNVKDFGAAGESEMLP
jgi:hypothetical protein